MRDVESIARDVLACADAWEPAACLMGNVRADELAALARAILGEESGAPMSDLDPPGSGRLDEE